MVQSTGREKKTHSPEGKAFTLLELIIAMSLAILLVSLAVPAINTAMREESLRQPAREIQALVRSGRQEAIRTQQSFALRLSHDKKSTVLALIPGNQAHQQKPSITDSVKIEPTLRLAHKTWQTEKWRYDANQQWFLQPTGLMEPIQFRIEKNRDWLEFEFHPLTGNVVEERFYFQ